MKTKDIFFIEVTDTFGGDANYSWANRYLVHAVSANGAIKKLARHSGAGWKKEYSTGDFARYNLANAAICCFVEWVDAERAAELRAKYSRIVEI